MCNLLPIIKLNKRVVVAALSLITLLFYFLEFLIVRNNLWVTLSFWFKPKTS